MAVTSSSRVPGLMAPESRGRPTAVTSPWAASTVSAAWVGPSTVTTMSALMNILSGWKCKCRSVPRATLFIVLSAVIRTGSGDRRRFVGIVPDGLRLR
jgi:hypothetical protein